MPVSTLEIGTELAHIYVRRTGPNPNIRVQLKLATEPSTGDRIKLAALFVTTRNHICRMLSEFGKPPDELETIGIVLGPLDGKGDRDIRFVPPSR